MQVISDSDRAGTEIVFEKENEHWIGDKEINIAGITDAAMCTRVGDYCDFPARRTVGRLMRQYLDEYGLSALELAFDASHLKLLENNEKLFPRAVQRADEIFTAITQIREHAGDTAAVDEFAGVIKTEGIDAVIGRVGLSVPRQGREVAIRFGMARYLKGAADWNGKLELLARLGEGDLSDPARRHLDEALAEILDGATAIMELLGGQPDMGTANRVIMQLAAGRCPAPKNPISPIEAMNATLARHALPLTQGVVYDRAALEIGGTRPLTREGREKDRNLFVTFIREFVDMSGLEGGPTIAAAILRRACIILGPEDENLNLEGALARLIDMLPHRAVRIGFLIDLVASPLGQDNQAMVFSTLGRLVGQLSSVASFLPKGSSPELLDATLSSLRQRLQQEGLPKAWRDSITQALDSVAERGVPMRGVADIEAYKLDEDTQRIIAMTPEQESFRAGETLFQEGEMGDEAYLIKSGEVEILHIVGNEQMVLARLGQGEIFGELSLIDSQPQMATARVSADAELAVISRDNIQSRLGRLEQSDMVLRRLIDVFVTSIRGEVRIRE